MRARWAIALLLVAAPRCFAWGCAGHRVAAYIALAHLRPPVAARVNRILAADPVRLRRHRPCTGAAPPMVAVASWADDVRDARTGPYHFVNIPAGARRPGFDYARLCAGDCVTAEIARFSRRLRAPNPGAGQRARALRFLIHLVADVHQPLHASNDQDYGGNCVATRVLGGRVTNLHADWDSVLLDRMLGPGGTRAFAARLDRRFGRRFAGGSMNPVDWAWQSQGLAVRDIYQPLRLAPGCRRLPLRLDAAYVRLADPVIEEQLDRAGWRLAELLNADLAPGGGSEVP